MKTIPLFQFKTIEEKEFLSPEFKLEFTSNSNGKIIYGSSDETVAIVDENGLVTITGAGTCMMIIYQEETDLFESIGVSKFLFVKKSNQIITVNPEVSTKSILDEPFELEIYSNSGAPITVTNTDNNIIILETIHNNKYKIIINSVGNSSLIIQQNGTHGFEPITKEVKIQIIENNLPTYISLSINSYNNIFKHDALNEVGILTSNNGSFNLSNNLKLTSNETVKGYIRDVGIACLDPNNFISNITGILCCPPKTL